MKKTILLSLACAASANAAIVSFDFSATIGGTSTTLDGTTVDGTVTYDDSVIMMGAPTDFFAPDASLSMTAFGQMFTDADDLEVGSFAIVTLSPTNELAFTFVVAESGGTNPTPINDARVTGFEVNLDPVAAGQASYNASVTVDTVPEPSAAGLMLLGALAFGARRRR